MRADFQRQVVECGKVNDKDSREGIAQSAHKIANAYLRTFTRTGNAASQTVHGPFGPVACPVLKD